MQIKIKWFGTANYILELGNVRLHFDPFFFRNENSFPELQTKKEEIKDINAIFISHGHFDHITEAGWLAENLEIPVYCFEIAKENIINHVEGKIIEDQKYSISEVAKNRIKTCKFHDKIQISPEVSVELIKSEHIKFDLVTILSRLFSWKFLKQIKSMAHLGKAFLMGDVFGFSTTYLDKNIISFGSLWHEYEDELRKHENCDIFIVPLAGNSKRHMAKKAGKMVDILKPKVVIPVHWDNFYPPISRLENLNPFYKYMENKHPNILIMMPKMDEEIVIDV